MEQLEQMPLQLRISWFPSQKVAAKPKLDKAEIAPMIEVNTEENRLVFGLLLMTSRWARTGRVLINFKMTDYTSSFSMQKWVKETQRFDIIKKNSWLVFVEMSRSIISHEIWPWMYKMCRK